MIFFTEKDKRKYDNSTKCHTCGKGRFVEGDDKLQKVRDHCHITGKFRGAADGNCNLNYQAPKFIPIVFQDTIAIFL